MRKVLERRTKRERKEEKIIKGKKYAKKGKRSNANKAKYTKENRGSEIYINAMVILLSLTTKYRPFSGIAHHAIPLP